MDKLTELGKQRGFVTVSEIADALPAAMTTEVADAYLETLAECGIRVVDDLKKNTVEAVRIDPDEEVRIGPDEVQEIAEYFRGRRVVGLSRDEELELAKEIEARDHAIIQAIVESSSLLEQLFTLGDQLRAGAIHVENVVRGGDDDYVCECIESVRTVWRDRGSETDTSTFEATRRRMFEHLFHLRFADGAFEIALGEVHRVAVEATSRLVEANQNQVASCAKEHAGRGVSFTELMAAGNVGLRKAVDRYEYRRGYRFSIYAQWWIRDAMVCRISGDR